MKKKLLVILILILTCFALTSCKKKEEEKIVGGWEIELSSQSLTIPEDALKSFNKALEKEEDNQYEPIALLGTQVVAGTNYMLLCSYTPTNTTKDTSYKVVIIYKDLKGTSTLSQTTDFDIYKYVGKEIKGTTEALAGGWTINKEMTGAKINEEIMEAFEKATQDTELKYTPITVLAKQIVSGMNYAILTLQEDTNGTVTINVLTIYKDLEENAKITHNAYVDLTEYNK